VVGPHYLLMHNDLKSVTEGELSVIVSVLFKFHCCCLRSLKSDGAQALNLNGCFASNSPQSSPVALSSAPLCSLELVHSFCTKMSS